MKNLIPNFRQSATSRLVDKWRRVPVSLRVLMASVLMQACKADEPPVRGQLMVVLQTDMSLPKDVTQVKIQIKRDGQLYHDKNYVVAPEDDWVTTLPGTLAVVASVDNPTPRVEVVVIGLRQTEARVFAKSVTTIPERRTATLFVPVQWLCEGQVKKLPGDAGYESTCSPSDGEERACRAGSCEKVEVDESSLSDYNEEDVFGGAEEGSKLGRCFDTQACFQDGFPVVPDEDCVVELDAPEGVGLNFGLLNPEDDDGIEFDDGPRDGDRLVPLDRSRQFGWDYVKGTKATSKPVRAQLPKGVCDQLEDEKFQSVFASYSCESKTLKYPTCGPWTALTVVGKVEVVSPQPTTEATSSTNAPIEAGAEDPDSSFEVQSLTIEIPEDAVFEIGIPVTLELIATPVEGGGPVDVATDALWETDDPDVATVEAGVVTGHSAGNTTITATYGGHTATFDIDVDRGDAEDLAVENEPAEPIPAGREHRLVAMAAYPGDEQDDVSELAEWTSSDETLATVENGVVKTLKQGFVTITATFEGFESEMELEVGEAVFTGNFAWGQRETGTTNEIQIVVYAVMSDGTQVEVTEEVSEWVQVGGEEFGTIDTDNGIVTIEAAGEIAITATYMGVVGSLRITVVFNQASADAG